MNSELIRIKKESRRRRADLVHTIEPRERVATKIDNLDWLKLHAPEVTRAYRAEAEETGEPIPLGLARYQMKIPPSESCVTRLARRGPTKPDKSPFCSSRSSARAGSQPSPLIFER
jgi:hypothetical protein